MCLFIYLFICLFSQCTIFSPQIITGMISSESELVKLSKNINPHLAKGCVEKWLLEVSRLEEF